MDGILSVVTVPVSKSAEHDRSLPDRPRERSREKDAGDKQRSASGRTEHNVMSQRDLRLEHSKDGSGERSRDTHGVLDRQPVKTAVAATSDSRAKSSSAGASGQLTTSTQPRSSAGSIPVRSDIAADKSLTKVSNFLIHAISVHYVCIDNTGNSSVDDGESW